MQRNILAKEIYNISHLTGSFKLRSGQISNEYFDKYLFESKPQILISIAKHMSRIIPKGTDVLAGLEMGGIPIATALSLKTGLPVLFVRKTAKEYGTCKLVEGIDVTGKNVCIIEDVVTTGGQIIISAEELKRCGANLNGVRSVILRNEEGKIRLREAGLELKALFAMKELTSHDNLEIQTNL